MAPFRTVRSHKGSKKNTTEKVGANVVRCGRWVLRQTKIRKARAQIVSPKTPPRQVPSKVSVKKKKQEIYSNNLVCLVFQEAQIEQLKSQKQEIFEKCELEGIILPTISDPMDTGSPTLDPALDFSQLSRSYLQNTRPNIRN